MSFKPIECPVCHALLRSKYEVRDADGEIRKWKWLAYCPVCGKRLRVVCYGIEGGAQNAD